MLRKSVWVGVFSTLSWLFFTESAYAYLDPGTGSIILQGLIAGVAATLFVLRSYWYRFLGLFSKKSAGVIEQTEENREKHETSSKDPE